MAVKLGLLATNATSLFITDAAYFREPHSSFKVFMELGLLGSRFKTSLINLLVFEAEARIFHTDL